MRLLARFTDWLVSHSPRAAAVNAEQAEQSRTIALSLTRQRLMAVAASGRGKAAVAARAAIRADTHADLRRAVAR